MTIKYEKPEVTQVGTAHVDQLERHPAYGQISASRYSGETHLYGSDFQHRNFIVIDIHKSELTRSLSKDWPHERDNIVSVAISEAQWAHFVSSFNVGGGTQCTILRIAGLQVPGISRPLDRAEQFTNEFIDRFDIANKGLDELRATIQASGLGVKLKEKMGHIIDSVEMNIGENVGFVAESFGKHMEKTKEAAKVEVNAHIQGVISRTGIAALQALPPISIEHKKGDEP